MKIGLIVRKFSTSGGTERYVYTISHELASLGNNVTVFCNKIESLPATDKIKLKRLGFPLPGRTLKTFGFCYYSKKVDISDFDIVQSCTKTLNHDIFRAGGGFHKLYLKYQKKRENFNFYDKLIISLERKIFSPKYTKAIVSVSKFLKNKIIEEFNYPEEKIFVIYNGVDIAFFKNEGEKELNKNLKILFVANDFKLKGLKELISAIKSINGVELTVVGNDKFYDDVPENVNFLGKKNSKELKEIYNKSHILVHPTYFDPFSNVCLEAMACGLPVVTTKINGVSEIIENKKDGIIIDYPPKVEEIIDAIEFYKKRENLISNSRNAVKKAEKFSIKNHVEKLLMVYEEVIKWKKN